ncbi:PadR family transcriptional regulator [Spelaeicoccus albus]|uniref:DNA-binding PadR family transcriptional regulator n=1 Tax=Spelaeicoccus albus TaxID=1280376 RepID=A0A7Z0ADA9_9MICO|nr:PadR family transcriptional regulator [Spelaeicoccus albus]NYI67386.1 DNA-binding PadR family transcriptional regulator [Spelaeicoccus albus]
MIDAAKPLSALGISVLALLTEGPLHPYEMHQTFVERHEDQIVNIKPGTLYHTVNRLAASELIEISGTDRAGNRPERTTYAITATGRSRLQADVVGLLGTPVNEYPRFPQAIAEAHNLPREIVLDQLRSRIDAFRERLDEFALARAAVVGKNLPERFWLDIDYLEKMSAAEMNWLTSLVERLQSHELDWPDNNESLQPPTSDIHSDSPTRTHR